MFSIKNIKHILRGLRDRVEEAKALPPEDKRMLVLCVVAAVLVVGILLSLHGIAQFVSETPASYSNLERSLLTTIVRETAN